ncbi:Zn-dependent hydrolase [Ruminococcaceae bacterium OttesenSCG-928-D13]|nr:Zn-dependent hydrolase [Ruminococcaceae bacterium OttesenSCG-928-D13]
MPCLTIDSDRLWARLHQLAALAEDPAGGISRLAWSPSYKASAQLLARWMAESGLTIRNDTVGNLYGRLPGQAALPAVLAGSHLDSVPNGGIFDGAAGVVAALEALTTLRENGVVPLRPLEMAAFVNEEGSRFVGGMFGSRAAAGLIPEGYVDTCCDWTTGTPLRQVLDGYGQGANPDAIAASALNPASYLCFLELHIEQGKHLLEKGLPLAVVSGIAGIRQFYIELVGESCHAGGMAMAHRHDAMAGAAAIIAKAEALALTSPSDTRATVGSVEVHPGEHNIVAGRVRLSVDYREADPAIWRQYYDNLMTFTESECARRGLAYHIQTTAEEAPAPCHPALTGLLKQAAQRRHLPHTTMVSYPAHDAVQMARIMPIGMLFLRSGNNGLSHCPQEYTGKEDLASGVQLLCDTLLELGQSTVSL